MSLAQLAPRSLFAFVLLCAPPTLVSAGTLNLSPGGTIDISAIPIGSVGDIGFADGRIWVADGTIGGQVYAVGTTGLLLNTIDPSVIPGLSRGPDAICTIGATGLILFSSFGESFAGRMKWTTSQLDGAFPSANDATGADFVGAGLWIASGTTSGVPSVLLQLDTTTGQVLTTLPVVGLTNRIVDLAFDPLSSDLYALCEDDKLREIDLATGAIVSTQDLAPFLIIHNSIAGGLDFDSTGAHLYVATGAGAGADSIIVLNREFSTNVCGSLLGGFVCPCGNLGITGRGCRNSNVGNNGALLTSTGIPLLGQDTFTLQASALPPGTFVLFFQGTTLNQPFVSFGDGVLCAGGAVIRLGVEAAPSGTAQYPGTGEPAIHVQGQILGANSTRLYQGWYRDSSTSFCTAAVFNLTNAVETEWQP